MLNIRTKPLIIRARLADLAGLLANPKISWPMFQALDQERQFLWHILRQHEAHHVPTIRTTIH